MARNKPQDIAVTEPTATTVDTSPVDETPKVADSQPTAPTARKLNPNQQVTLSGALRTDH